MLSPGTVLQGRYVVDRILGSGGFGVVYLARHALLGDQPVAVKELSWPEGVPELQATALAQFRTEAGLLTSLRHPGLVEVTDFFEEEQHAYLVMAYVEGRTLQQVCEESEGFLQPGVVLAWVDQVCEVLEWLHGRTPPVIYRDLKPANVMLDATGRIRLLDFGIARVLEEGSRTATLLRGVGTPGFAPPEQAGQGTTDPRSDIYALGATIYSLLTRRQPPPSVDLLVQEGSLPRPRELNSAISPGLEDLILKMMAPRKEHRYHDVREVRLAVEDLKRGRWGGHSRASLGAGVASEAPALRLKRVVPGREGAPRPVAPAPALAPPRPPASVPASEEGRGAGGPATVAPAGWQSPSPLAPPSREATGAAAPRLPGEEAWKLLSQGGSAAVVTGASLHDPGFGYAGAGIHVAEERVPSWARDATDDAEPEAPPPPPGTLYDRFWRWYLYVGIMVVAVAAEFPLLFSPRAMGPLEIPNSLLYNLGHALAASAGSDAIRCAGGLAMQMVPALVLALFFYWHEDFFAALAFTLWGCESLFEVGVCMRTSVGWGLHWSMGADLHRLLPSLGGEDFLKVGRAVHLVAMFGLGACFYGMARWLYRYRPNRLLLAYYAGRLGSGTEDAVTKHGVEALLEAEQRAIRHCERMLRPVVNLSLTWLCLLVCSEAGLLRLSPPTFSSDPEVNLYLGVGVISLVMFCVSELVELIYSTLVSFTESVLFLLLPVYVLAAGLIRLKVSEGLLQGWFTPAGTTVAFVILVLILGGTRWHLDRIVPSRNEPVGSDRP